jgi:hypothetical protein
MGRCELYLCSDLLFKGTNLHFKKLLTYSGNVSSNVNHSADNELRQKRRDILFFLQLKFLN